MTQPYSQSKALWAITRASFRAIFNHPTAIVFSLLFPVIFIMIFGAFGNNGPARQRIALDPGCDTANSLFDSIRNSSFIRIMKYNDTTEMRENLEKGNLTAIIKINSFRDSSGQSRYFIHVRSTSASGNNLGIFLQMLQNITLKIERAITGGKFEHFIVKPEVYEGKKYRQIDFIFDVSRQVFCHASTATSLNSS